MLNYNLEDRNAIQAQFERMLDSGDLAGAEQYAALMQSNRLPGQIGNEAYRAVQDLPGLSPMQVLGAYQEPVQAVGERGAHLLSRPDVQNHLLGAVDILTGGAGAPRLSGIGAEREEQLFDLSQGRLKNFTPPGSQQYMGIPGMGFSPSSGPYPEAGYGQQRDAFWAAERKAAAKRNAEMLKRQQELRDKDTAHRRKLELKQNGSSSSGPSKKLEQMYWDQERDFRRKQEALAEVAGLRDILEQRLQDPELSSQNVNVGGLILRPEEHLARLQGYDPQAGFGTYQDWLRTQAENNYPGLEGMLEPGEQEARQVGRQAESMVRAGLSGQGGSFDVPGDSGDRARSELIKMVRPEKRAVLSGLDRNHKFWKLDPETQREYLRQKDML